MKASTVLHYALKILPKMCFEASRGCLDTVVL